MAERRGARCVLPAGNQIAGRDVSEAAARGSRLQSGHARAEGIQRGRHSLEAPVRRGEAEAAWRCRGCAIAIPRSGDTRQQRRRQGGRDLSSERQSSGNRKIHLQAALDGPAHGACKVAPGA